MDGKKLTYMKLLFDASLVMKRALEKVYGTVVKKFLQRYHLT